MPLSDERDELDFTFEAEDDGPPRRRFWLYPANADGGGSIWVFVFEQESDGEWAVGWDTVDNWFFQIMRYPEEYASGPLIWRRKSDGQIVDLDVLQERIDEFRAPESYPEKFDFSSRSTRTYRMSDDLDP